jgi:signal transduction histidine kinase
MRTEKPGFMTNLPELEPENSAPEEERLPFRVEDLPHLSAEEAQLLSRHFEVFNETTNKLVAAHQVLQRYIQALMSELELKNQELERVNRELATKVDETERVREFLDRVIDSMHTGLVAVDQYCRLTRMNRAARLMLGWGDTLPEKFDGLLAEGVQNPILMVQDSDSESREGEIRLCTASSETVLVRYSAVPIRQDIHNDESGDGFLFMFEDLSRLVLLEEKVRRSDRLAALGELAAGVAHETRNPLATIRGFLQLLPSEYEDPDFRQECSTRVIGEIDRLARLTDDLLELARPIRPEQCETDLHELIGEVLDELGELFSQNGVAREQSLVSIPLLPLDRDRIKQVLLNLVINAVQAMPQGGQLKVRLLECEEEWEEKGETRPWVCLEIEDSGSGIESRYLDRIFDPFFTTKDHGTGLGLALCHRIIEEHGGVIRVASTPGKGTTFRLYFPRSWGVGNMPLNTTQSLGRADKNQVNHG